MSMIEAKKNQIQAAQPNNTHAEMSVLGAVILDNSMFQTVCAGLAGSDFCQAVCLD